MNSELGIGRGNGGNSFKLMKGSGIGRGEPT